MERSQSQFVAQLWLPPLLDLRGKVGSAHDSFDLLARFGRPKQGLRWLREGTDWFWIFFFFDSVSNCIVLSWLCLPEGFDGHGTGIQLFSLADQVCIQVPEGAHVEDNLEVT